MRMDRDVNGDLVFVHQTQQQQANSQLSSPVDYFKTITDEYVAQQLELAKLALLDMKNVDGDNTVVGHTLKSVFQGMIFDNTAAGVSGTGDFVNAVSNVDTNVAGYLHFRLPIDSSTYRAFALRFTGYSGSTGVIIDEQVAAYNSMSALPWQANSGAMLKHIYRGSDDHVYIRLSIATIYYLVLNIDSVAVGIGAAIPAGSIVAIVDSAEEL